MRLFLGTPALARLDERTFREVVRVGYRAPHLVALCRAVAIGQVDPEGWNSEAARTPDLRRKMLDLPGVGPYVAENLLKFLGRPDGLALDSWMRAKYARLHHGGRRITDRTIVRRYRRLGAWAGLAAWCELTADWLRDGRPSQAWEDLG